MADNFPQGQETAPAPEVANPISNVNGAKAPESVSSETVDEPTNVGVTEEEVREIAEEPKRAGEKTQSIGDVTAEEVREIAEEPKKAGEETQTTAPVTGVEKPAEKAGDKTRFQEPETTPASKDTTTTAGEETPADASSNASFLEKAKAKVSAAKISTIDTHAKMQNKVADSLDRTKEKMSSK